MALSAEVVVIDDSDSESTTINPDNNWPKKKRPLAEPFSEEEDNNEDITTLPLKPIQTNILPKIKRPLAHGFSNEENVEYENSDAGSGDAAAPSKIKENAINKLHNSLNHPLACSTPLPALNHDTANTLGNHIGYKEALQISRIDSNNISDTCSVSSIDSEQIIILDQSSTTKNGITVKENIIIATSYTNSVTKAVSPHSSNSENPVSPSKRGCAEQEKDRKKLKTIHENSSCGSKVPSMSKENESSLEMSQGNSTCGRSFGIESTRRSIADGEMDASREVGKKVSKSAGKCLSKKNKSDCDSNQRKTLNLGEEARKNIKTSHRNACDISQKSDLKKSPQTNKNSIKVPSKENIPNCSKNLGNNSNDGSFETPSGLSHVERDKNSTSVKGAKSGSSPKKRSNVTRVSLDKSFKAKKEEKKMNKEPLLLITELFKTVFSSRHVNNLCETEREAIRMFLNMDFKYQYACLKLITRQRKWYNIYKFCSLIYLEMEETDISDMAKFFERKGIVDTVYTEESAEHLLSRLNNTEIKGICDKFRIKKALKKKDEMIKHLLKYTNNQCTLTVHKTTKTLLMDEIQRRLGRCMRVSKNFLDAFYSIYTLSTYTNPRFSSMKDYFNSMLYLKVQVPEYDINDYTIFNSRNDFIRYLEAKKYRDELENCKNHLECLQLCETVFAKLKALENHNSDDETFQNAPHLVRFTARAVYVSSLSSMTNKLFAKFPNQVKTWLEYMIKKVNFPHKIGHWYYHLIWLYMKYLKPFNYNRAAELLVDVLHLKGRHLSEVQLYRLRERGKRLLSTRKYKILQMNHDLIVHLLPKRIKVEEFPEETIDAKAIRSNLPQKRNYEVQDGEGNKIIYKVEDIALEHYFDHGYTGGEHCEGAFVLATFTLFFFDIIYKPRDVIPGTFVSKVQSEPLDMNSRYFYSNRREQIDRRLREIENEWSDSQVLKFLTDNYEKHSHEFALCEVGTIIKDEGLLKVLVECVGRKIWAKIYERLVKNFREYRSGQPDLLVWNKHKKYCKFVEVKGENDKLSVGQKLWLDYLRKIGAQIEVCHVHSIGSKRKMKKVGGKDLQEASTSSSSSSEKVP